MKKNDGSEKVDMLAEAREAQWSALTFMGEDTVKAIAPAKVNLFLAVGRKGNDGYHEVVTAMHALALHDVLYFTCNESSENANDASEDSMEQKHAEENDSTAFAGPGGCIKVHIEVVDKTHVSGIGASSHLRGAVPDIPIKQNLVFKAIDSLAHELGISRDQEVSVRIEKNIPTHARLGGASTDASVTLLAMCDFWGSSDSGPSIHKVAASLGADVSFFLKGGCGIFTGRGEAFERVLVPMKHPVVIVRPHEGVSTKEAYSKFDENPIKVPAELLARVEDASDADQIPLYNNLQPIACELLPEVGRIVDWLRDRAHLDSHTDVSDEELSSNVLMSGSGSAVFAVVDTYADATNIAADAAKQGWWSRATTFSSLRAAVL